MNSPIALLPDKFLKGSSLLSVSFMFILYILLLF